MSQTQENLLKAFAGESQARNKYTFDAQKAIQEGYVWIARIFEETADNERSHAERLYQSIEGPVKMTNSYGIDKLADTKTNLLNATGGENYETTTMYPEFEKTAREEGFDVIANTFKEIGEVEEKHEERFKKMANRIEAGDFFESSDENTEWKCLNCGYIHKGSTAPKICPACAKPQGWYMQLGFVR